MSIFCNVILKMQNQIKKLTTILILVYTICVFSMPAESRPSNKLVLPLENLLIQGIPAFLVKDTPKEDLIVITHNGRNYNFAIRANIRDFLAKAIVKGYKFDIYSQLPLESVNAALLEIKISGKSFKDLVENIKSKEDMNDGKFNFTIWQGQKSPPFLVTSSGALPGNQNDFPLAVDLGPTYYNYDSFASVEANRKAGDSNFPANEELWYAERFKIGQLYLLLEESENIATDQFANIRDRFFQENRKHLSRIGIEKILGEFKELRAQYKISDDKNSVSGCTLISWRHNKIIGLTKMSDCMDSDKPIAYWTDRKKKQCSYFTKELAIIKDKASGCDQDHIYFLKDEKVWIVYQESNDISSLTDENLAAYLSGPKPNENNVFLLWQKQFKKKTEVLNLQSCRDRGYQTNKLKPGTDELFPGCEPDVLYSWGPQVKIEDFKKVMGIGPWAKFLPRTIFTTRSPIATFGYGPVSMRIKLISNVKFKNSGYYLCKGTAEELTTVFFRKDDSYADWVICSPNVIHSWSYSLKPHYDEMIKDYQQRKVKPIEADYYGSNQYQQQNIFTHNLDGHNFSEMTLVHYLKGILKQIETNQNGIFYNPDIPENQKNIQNHFMTTVPTYFNEE